MLATRWLSLDSKWRFHMRSVYNENAKFYYDINGFMIETTDSSHSREGVRPFVTGSRAFVRSFVRPARRSSSVHSPISPSMPPFVPIPSCSVPGIGVSR